MGYLYEGDIQVMARYRVGRGGGGRTFGKVEKAAQTKAVATAKPSVTVKGSTKKGSTWTAPKVTEDKPVTQQVDDSTGDGGAEAQRQAEEAQQERQRQAEEQSRKEEQEREAREERERQEKNLGREGESWLDQGYKSTAIAGLTGDLHAQLSAFTDLEGGMRPGYDWKTDFAPQSIKEGMAFLEGARGDEANNVLTLPVTDQVRQQAQDAAYQGQATEEQQALLDAISSGQQTIYMMNGRVLSTSNPADADLIGRKNKIDEYRGAAEGLIEDGRQRRMDMLSGAITQGNQLQLQKQTSDANKRMTEMEVNANKEIAMFQRQLDERLSKAQITADKETTATRGTQALAQIRETGTQNVAQIKAEGETQITALKEKLAGDLKLQQDQAASQEKMQTNQMNNELLKIEKESSAQERLLSMNHDFDSEMESSKQQWQTLESAKDRAMKSQDMAEYRRAAMAQEQISRDELALQREGQNIGLLVSISSNPALLYYMNESGMLGGMGKTLLGEDVTRLIGDLTASIEPGKVPNIQTYNAMGETQQRMASFQAGATQGMSQEGFQEYVQSTAPFTRGRPSAIRIGSDANPFQTQGA
jgi:hypothetical protein